MAAGRKTGGRQKGTRNKRTAAVLDKAQAEGKLPLDVMLENMRFWDDKAAELLAQIMAPDGDRDAAIESFKVLTGARQNAQECAKDAAPYMHPRLNAVEHTGKGGGPMHHHHTGVDAPVKESREEWLARQRAAAMVPAAGTST